MGARVFQNKKYCNKWHFLISLIFFGVLSLVEIIFLKKGYLISDNYIVTMESVGLSFFIYLLLICITYMYFGDKNFKNASFVLLFVVVIFDLLIGAKSGQNNNDKYIRRDVVQQYDSFMEFFTSKLESPETERIYFEPDEYGSNMSLKYGYSNIGFFTSARNRDTLKSMYRLGYNVQMDEQLWITSYSGTFLNYSIAGVKYYITKNGLKNNEIYGFEFDEKYGDFYIYKNRNNFNIGYYLAENIEESYNPFKMQNDLLSGLKKKDTEVKQYFQNVENSSVLECDKITEFNEETQEYTIKYTLKAKKDCNIYLASDYNLQLYINGKTPFEDYANIWSTETGIKQIKNLEKNEELEFIIKTKQNLELLYIYVSDNEEIQKVLDNKNENYFSDVEINKNGLTGTAVFKDDGYLVFSIAYDNCWDIYVDGKKVEKEAIAGCFLGVKLEEGEHDVKIKASIFPQLSSITNY